MIKRRNEEQKMSDRLPLEFDLLARFELSVTKLSIDD